MTSILSSLQPLCDGGLFCDAEVGEGEGEVAVVEAAHGVVQLAPPRLPHRPALLRVQTRRGPETDHETDMYGTK